MSYRYIEKLKNEIKEKYSENNIYYRYLANIDKYKRTTKCSQCGEKSYYISEGKERKCSNCGTVVGYLDKGEPYEYIMIDALSNFTDEQRKLIEKYTMGMDYDYVLSFLLDLESLSKKKINDLLDI